MYVYIYIYIERERERERDKKRYKKDIEKIFEPVRRAEAELAKTKKVDYIISYYMMFHSEQW